MSRKKFMATLTAIVEVFKRLQWSTNERSCRQECTLFPFCYPHVFPPSTLNHQELVKRRMMINPRTKAPIAIHSVRRHQLIPLPRRMIRIPLPNENAVSLQFSATTSRQDTKPRKSCFYNAVAAWGCMKRSELYGWLIFEGYEMCLWTGEVIPYTQARRSN